MAERKWKYRSTVDWTPVPGEEIEGVIKEIDHLPESAEERRYLIVDTPESILRVYEVYVLTELFNVAVVGDHIYLRFIAEKDLGGGKTVKRFDSRLWTE